MQADVKFGVSAGNQCVINSLVAICFSHIKKVGTIFMKSKLCNQSITAKREVIDTLQDACWSVLSGKS